MTAPPPRRVIPPGVVLGILGHAITQGVYLFDHSYQRPVSTDNRVWYRGVSEELATLTDPAVDLFPDIRDPQRAQWESAVFALRIASVNTAALPSAGARAGQNRFDIFDVETLDGYEIKPDNPAGRANGARELQQRLVEFNIAYGRSLWREARPGTSFPPNVPGRLAQLTIPIPLVGTYIVTRYDDAPGLLLWKLRLNKRRNPALEDIWKAYAETKETIRSFERARTYVEIGAVISAAVIGSVVAAEAGAAAIAALSGEAAVMASLDSTSALIMEIAPTAEALEIVESAEVVAALEERALLQQALGRAAGGGGGIPPIPPGTFGPPGIGPPGIMPPTMMPPSSLIPPSMIGPMGLIPLANPSLTSAALQDVIKRVRAILEVGAEAVRWLEGLEDKLNRAIEDVFMRWDTQLQEAAVWEPDIPYFRQGNIPPARFDLPTGQQPVFQRRPGGVLGDVSGDVPVAEPDTPEYGVAPSRAERQQALDAALDEAAVVGIADEMVAALQWAGNETNPFFSVTSCIVQELMAALAQRPGGLAKSLTDFGVSPSLNPRRRTDWPPIANALLGNRTSSLLRVIAITEFLVTVPQDVWDGMTESVSE